MGVGGEIGPADGRSLRLGAASQGCVALGERAGGELVEDGAEQGFGFGCGEEACLLGKVKEAGSIRQVDGSDDHGRRSLGPVETRPNAEPRRW